MKKKNLIVIALASTALAIGGGVALASSMSTKAVEVKADVFKTFGFVNSSNWASVNVHKWRQGGSGTTWPGEAASLIDGRTYDGKTMYQSSVNVSTYDWVIFNDGTHQTDDLDIRNINDGSFYHSGSKKWFNSHSWALCGEFDGASWADNVKTGNTTALSFTDWTFTVTLKEGDSFKFHADNAWSFQLGGAIIAGRHGDYFSTADDGNGGTNAVVRAGKGGTYTFTINWNVENYDDKTYGVSVDSYIPDSTAWKMVGNGSLWDGSFVYANGLAMTPEDAAQVKIVNVSLAAGDTFRFYDQSKTLGWTDVKAGSPINGNFENDSGNIKVKTGKAGTYTFYVDTTQTAGSANSIWITQDAYVKLDGWATAFIKNDIDFCDADDTDWATFASRFNSGELSEEARDIFRDVTANASGNNIEKAAARYDNAVANHGKTPFAGSGGKRASAAHIITPMKDMEGGVATAITVTAAIGAAAAVGFFFIRKRKAI